jgi:hypothetical protein
MGKAASWSLFFTCGVTGRPVVTDDTRRPGAFATREVRPCHRSVRRRTAEPVSEMADRQRAIGSPRKSLDTTVL